MDEPPSNPLSEVDRWQREEDDHQRFVDRLAMAVTIVVASMIFTALLMLLMNDG